MSADLNLNVNSPDLNGNPSDLNVNFFDQIIGNIEKVIVGKKDAVELALIALVCGGHVLIEDLPGMGKTMLASCLAKSLDCSFGRIQFTPDLLPSDITGFNMYDMATNRQVLCAGSIMRQIVIADEINRASPKTQSALLEAMQEGQVTIDGRTILLPSPFMVLATQNPIEFAGTYPLPESQLDRFMLRIVMGYPTFDEEMQILSRHQSRGEENGADIGAVASAQDVLRLRRELARVVVSDGIKQYIIDIAAATRSHQAVDLPVSPRGSIALLRASMGCALLHGRDYVLPDDVRRLTVSVLAHRCLLSPAALAKETLAEDVLSGILNTLPVPLAS